MLPSHLSYAPDSELLLIGTQTCSLAGAGAEPSFEVVVASPLPEFKEDTDSARGRRTRYIELPVEGSPSIAGVALDVSRRAILPRECLGGMELLPLRVPDLSAKAFQGWMARYYARIALPDALIKRLEKRQFQKRLSKAKSHKLLDGLNRYDVSSDIHRIYMTWSPDAEILPAEDYTVGVLIVCGRRGTEKYLLEELAGLASGVKGKPLVNGLIMDDPDVQLASEVKLEDTLRMRLFTALDELTGFIG
ncbi:hypothetical protein HB662_10210 [Roseomonas frigidaquae]|uniref:Uncharacterized protein n=1 Tax=Falsiroseomonas frigidaquae TaxID=487318 RepID=A0ABX1EYI1_9PROT|nr:hypothetical protein [Falsiroseomonas frigidaquae]NKE45153.1 hypothetical protein [Falsiroseomonas frigidaquae]